MSFSPHSLLAVADASPARWESWAGYLVGGLLLLIAIGLHIWRQFGPIWAKSFLTNDWINGVMIFVRSVQAIALASLPKPNSASAFFQSPSFVFVVSFAAWEFLGFLIDRNVKKETRSIEDLESKNNELTHEIKRRVRLIVALGSTVYFKLEAIRQGYADASASRKKRIVDLQLVRQVLKPKERAEKVLEVLSAHLEELDGDGNPPTFRIGFYVSNTEGYLCPWVSFDSAKKTHDCFTSFQKNSKSFALDNNPEPSVAVQSINDRHIVIVPDCDQDESVYLHRDQRNYLKSLVSYPIFSLGISKEDERKACLVVDTPRASFFRLDQTDWLNTMLKAFACRLELEYALDYLLSPDRTKPTRNRDVQK